MVQIAWQMLERSEHSSAFNDCDFSIKSAGQTCPLTFGTTSAQVGAKDSPPIESLSWKTFPDISCVARCGVTGEIAFLYRGDTRLPSPYTPPGSPRYSCKQYYNSSSHYYSWSIAVGFAWAGSPKSAAEIAREQIPSCDRQ